MMLGCLLCPPVFGTDAVLHFVRASEGEESETTAGIANARLSLSIGTLQGLLYLSVFCHLQHCQIAGAGHKLQVGSGPVLAGPYVLPFWNRWLA